MKVSPAIKAEIDKQMPKFETLGPRPKYIPPDKVLREMDADIESFFFKREYTERNFGFYLQICAQQHKPEEAMKAFRRMEALQIKPTDGTYT